MLELDPFTEWLHENWTQYASDSKTGKKLICNHRGLFKVTLATNNGVETIWTGGCSETAIEKYNEL